MSTSSSSSSFFTTITSSTTTIATTTTTHTSSFPTITTTTTHASSSTTGRNKTTKPTTTTQQEDEIWFFVLNPLFILALIVISCLCIHSIYKYINRKGATTPQTQSTMRMRVGVLICVCLFGIVRSISLGMQIQMGISTKGMTQMFSCVRIAALAPLYGALLVILRKWVIVCVNMNSIVAQRGNAPYYVINIFFTLSHLFVYFSLGSGIVKNAASLNYNQQFSNIYEYLVVIIFGYLFVCFSASGGYMLYLLCYMRNERKQLQLGATNTSSIFIKKLAIVLTIFLVCLLWRCVDYAVYKWAKTPNGKWVYTSDMQVKLYPLMSTFPECLPIAVCFLLYRARLPWEKRDDDDSAYSESTPTPTTSSSPQKSSSNLLTSSLASSLTSSTGSNNSSSDSTKNDVEMANRRAV